MDKDGEDIRCQEMWRLDQDKEYDKVVEHLLTGCLNCITNPKKRFDGREMLFPNGPPPWIVVPEAEKNNPDSWKKYQKKKVHVEMTAEEFEKHLIDSDIGPVMMAFEIAKFKRCEKVEAWKYVNIIQKKKREIFLEQEKKAKEIKKKELEAKKESEKIKKADEKRKSTEQKQQKDEEKQEYLDKMQEEEKLLDAVLNEGILPEKESESDSEDPEGRASKLDARLQKSSFNLKHQMPWSPSTYDFLCFEQRSKADQAQQKRIIGMCQSMLYEGALRFNANKVELRDLRHACASEYETLATAALQHAQNEAVHPLDFITLHTSRKCFQKFQMREPDNALYLFKTPVFTVKNIEASTGVRSENQALIPKMETLLKGPGWMNQLVIPDMSKKCELRVFKRVLPGKIEIRHDNIAQSLISTCSQVSVMMDATTACHLLTPSWEGRDYEFGIPILVKTERVDGQDKKIVILSKPMPSNTISNTTLQRKNLKQSLKAQFLAKKDTYAPTQKLRLASEPSTSSQKAAAEENVFMFPDSQESVGSIDSQSSDVPSTSNDLLDNIISKMDKPPNQKPKNEAEVSNSSHQYAVFRIGDARILVRSNAPYTYVQRGERQYHMLQNAKGVTFEPRVEYLPNGGAMELGTEEWVWNYTKALLKMSDSHILYRASYKIDNILQVDAITMRIDLQEPPPDALGLLSARSLMLEQMIAQLENLEDGEYMAFQSANAPLVVAPKCDADHRGGVSIKAMRIKDGDVQQISKTIGNNYFHGFSRDVAFQWQIVQGRAPQMLLAEDSPMAHLKPSKCNVEKVQRRKYSLKRKFEERAAEKQEAKRHGEIDLDDPNLYADFTNPAVVPMDFRPNYADSNKKKGGRGKGRGNFFGRGGGRGGGNDHRGGGRGRGRGRGGFQGSQDRRGANTSSDVVNIP